MAGLGLLSKTGKEMSEFCIKTGEKENKDKHQPKAEPQPS